MLGAANGHPFHVGILPLGNFTLLAFASFVDTLRLSADEGDGSRQKNCRWTVISSTSEPVLASCGVAITPDQLLGDPGRFDYIAVVGGILDRGKLADEATLAWLRAAAAVHVTLIGLCVGTFALIRAGVMQGRKVCISSYHASDLDAFHENVAVVSDQWFVADGERITSPGGVAAADVAALLIKRHCGESWALKGLQLALIDRHRTANHPQPVAIAPMHVDHARLQRAVKLIEQRLSNPPNLPELARHAHLSPRQLQRLFKQAFAKSPHQFSRDVRARYGRLLLERTDRSISLIAEACGFAGASHFGRAIRAQFGRSPQALRSELRRPGTAPAGVFAHHLPWRPEGTIHFPQVAANRGDAPAGLARSS